MITILLVHVLFNSKYFFHVHYTGFLFDINVDLIFPGELNFKYQIQSYCN